MSQNSNNSCSLVRQAIIVSLGAFFLAIGIGIGSQILLENIKSLLISGFLLLIIIFVGIVFDTIGTAATAACEAPFHAKAARKIFGAKYAINLVKNADIVANICNDVVGDVSSSLSGAVGATIIANVFIHNSDKNLLLASTVMTGIIAGFTVGGKALGKSIAISKSNDIIFSVAKILSWIEVYMKIGFFRTSNKKGRTK